MILTGKEIIKQVRLGTIIIDPFDERNINPNSYNYRLGEEITQVSSSESISTRYDAEVDNIEKISEDGLILKPGKIYLASTYEIIGSNRFVTSLIGRSSVGRLGLFLQISADLGNLGPAHKWTLELVCVQPVVIYPRMKIGQISFWVPYGKIEIYDGEYTNYNIPKHCINKFFNGE